MWVASPERQTPRWEPGGGFGAHPWLQAGVAEQIGSQRLIGAPLRPGPGGDAAERDTRQRGGLVRKPRPLGGRGHPKLGRPGPWVWVTARTGVPWERRPCAARPAPSGCAPRARRGPGAGTIVSVLYTQASVVTRGQPVAALLPLQGEPLAPAPPVWSCFVAPRRGGRPCRGP